MRRWLLTRRSSWPVRARAWLEQRARRVLAAGAAGGWYGRRDWGGRNVCEAGAAGACAVEADDVRGRRDWGGRSVCEADARYRFFVACNRFKSVGLPTLRDPDACSPLAVRVSLCRTWAV